MDKNRVLRLHSRWYTPYLGCLMKNQKDPLTCGTANHQYLNGYSSATQILVEFLAEIKQPYEFVLINRDNSQSIKYFNNTLNRTVWRENYSLGLLEGDKIDVPRFSYTFTAEREADFEFSYPIRYIKSGFVYRDPDFIGSPNVLTQMFTLLFWIALVACMAATLLSFGLHYFLYLPEPTGKRSFFRSIVKSAWGMIRMLSGTDFDEASMEKVEKRSKVSFRNTQGLFLVLILFNLSLYQATLLESMLMETPPAFESTSELAQLVSRGDRYLIRTTATSSYFSRVRDSNTKAFEEMRKALEANPPVSTSNLADPIAQYIRENPKAVLVGVSYARAKFIASKRCGLKHQIDLDNNVLLTTGFIFRKKDPILNQLNAWIIGRGRYPMKVIEEDFETDRRNHSFCRKPLPGDPLLLGRITGVFYLCAFGCTIGMVALICELLMKKRYLTKESNQQDEPTTSNLNIFQAQKST